MTVKKSGPNGKPHAESTRLDNDISISKAVELFDSPFLGSSVVTDYRQTEHSEADPK